MKVETCTCVTYIAKSNNGSMQTTNHTSWSRLCTCVEGGWWKWNTPFVDLSPFYLDNKRTWLYYYRCFFFLDLHVSNFFSTLESSCIPLFFGSCFLGMLSFLSFFIYPMPHLRDAKERSFNMEFYFVDGWNGIANFQCRSLAGELHMILIKQVWKTSH